jgi:hypothetical protein
MSNPPEAEPCNVCGGDGTIENAWGQIAKCPSCHGNGRRQISTGFHDVTKTKPSHHTQSNVRGQPAAKQTTPTTPSGMALAAEIERSTTLSAERKKQLTLEVYEHESTHGLVTKTFLRKMRKSAGLNTA